MQVKQMMEILSKMNENEEIFVHWYFREEADDLLEQDDLPQTTDEEWLEIVRYMQTDDGIHEEGSNSFSWAMERLTEKREKQNAN